MARKTLKQKLRSQNGKLRVMLQAEHNLAGLTINHEQRKLQAIAMAHGIMGTLIVLRQEILKAGGTEEDEIFKAVQALSQTRIGQCVVALGDMGMPHEEANARILQGY